jgi:hypothetical protein
MKTGLRAPAVLALALALSTPIVRAASDEDRAAFREAYAEYNTHIEQGDYQAALQSAQQALTLGKAVFGEDSKNYASLNHNYGTTQLKAVQAKEGFATLRSLLPLYETLYGKDSL